MRNLLILILILTVATGCDYGEVSLYKIVNKSSKDMLVKTHIDPYDNGINFSDSIYVIPQGGLKEFYQNRGIVGKKFVPPNYFEPFDSLPPVNKFEIYIDSVLIDTLRLGQFWKFSADERIGNYTLTLTDELLDSL